MAERSAQRLDMRSTLRVSAVLALLAPSHAYPVYARRKANALAASGKSVDQIICPVVAAGVNMGDLETNDGVLEDVAPLGAFVTKLGLSASIVPVFVEGLKPLLPVDLHAMDGHFALEHGNSSGIRDPQRNRTALNHLYSFADANGTMDAAALTAAGTYFDAHPNPESHVGVSMATVTASFICAMLPVFGRCGPSVRTSNLGPVSNRYPDRGKIFGVPCDASRVFMTIDDLEALFWRSVYPAGFVVVSPSPEPPPSAPPAPPPLLPPLPCQDWCYDHDGGWQKICTFRRCSGCPACHLEPGRLADLSAMPP